MGGALDDLEGMLARVSLSVFSVKSGMIVLWVSGISPLSSSAVYFILPYTNVSNKGQRVKFTLI